MGQTSHNTPGEFAGHLNAYLWSLVAPRGADRSGRWMADLTGGARKKDYWSDVLSNTKSMTANDIQVVAELVLGITPYQFIRDAREWKASGEIVECGPNGNAPTSNQPVSLADRRKSVGGMLEDSDHIDSEERAAAFDSKKLKRRDDDSEFFE